MPDEYTDEALLHEIVCVRRGFNTLKAKYNQFLADCSFSRLGKSAIAVSTVSANSDRIPPIPPRPARDRSTISNAVSG